MKRSQLSISPPFAQWLAVAWLALLCDAAGAAYLLRHHDPRFELLYEHTSTVRADVLCTWVPLACAVLAIAGLIARRRWGWSLALLLTLAAVAGSFAVTGTAYWMARPYGADGAVLKPAMLGVPGGAFLMLLVLLAPSVRRGFR